MIVKGCIKKVIGWLTGGGSWVCRRVELKKAWAVHLAEQQQKQQQGSDAEEEEAQDAEPSAADAAEVHC